MNFTFHRFLDLEIISCTIGWLVWKTLKNSQLLSFYKWHQNTNHSIILSNRFGEKCSRRQRAEFLVCWNRVCWKPCFWKQKLWKPCSCKSHEKAKLESACFLGFNLEKWQCVRKASRQVANTKKHLLRNITFHFSQSSSQLQTQVPKHANYITLVHIGRLKVFSFSFL